MTDIATCNNELRPEYNETSLKNGIRGKYAEQYAAGTNIVRLAPDIAAVFPNDGTVEVLSSPVIGGKSTKRNIKKITRLVSVLATVIFVAGLSACEQLQQMVQPTMSSQACTDGARVLNVGFYAYFSPVSYSANENPASDAFNTHLGYEADLLTVLEAMEGTGLSFVRRPIAVWPDIWLKSAEPEYDIVGGGITILDSRTRDATGNTVITFTSGHIKFRQSLLVRTEDAERFAVHANLTSAVRVGVLPATTGEARLLELTGLVDPNGILVEGTRVETPLGTVVADGTAAYTITAAGTTPNLAGRSHLYPPLESMPQVIYLGDEVGESALLDALAAGMIDAIARGEVGNRDVVQASNSMFAVTALDEQFELGGFTLAVEDAALAACIDEKLNYLTDNRNIGYAEWVADPSVFMRRAQMWNNR